MSRMEIGKRRKKAVRVFLGFLGVMGVCTGVSRGIYAYQMPQVETGRAAGKSISHEVSVSGVVEAARERDVVVAEGVRVREICVKVGEKVEKGKVLMRVDVADLEELTQDVGEKIKLEEGKIAAADESKRMAGQKAREARQRAQREFRNVREVQDQAVSDARSAYERAKEKWEEYPARADFLEERVKKDVEYQVYKRQAERNGATQEDRDTFDIYREKLVSSAEAEWEEGKKALREDLEQKRAALSMAKADRKSAVLQAKRAVGEAGDTEPVDESAQLEGKNAIEQLRKQREGFQKLLDNKGKVVSEDDGYVTECCVKAGDRTADSAAILLADGSHGWNFRAEITEEQTQLLSTGDTVTLIFQNGKVKEEDCVISAIRPTEDGMYEAVAAASGEDHFLGETGSLERTDKSRQFSCCVPLSALYSDNNKDYVLLMREVDTILGTEWSVVKKEVTVVDQNESDAALEDGSLQEEDEIVVFASKAVAPGDKVRLVESGEDADDEE